eukprot:TRINITY_DN1943_c0_g1_i1.p2 TRINITY_DN1943_c0_g1~~TRINITY_DN1943_c0_g1_i1.p2  ORF type:complete len:139 (+),score=32.58 TRINITY_DN1943_c0_g1_i1:213-629(+)
MVLFLIVLLFVFSPFIGLFAGGYAVFCFMWRVFARPVGRIMADTFGYGEYFQRKVDKIDIEMALLRNQHPEVFHVDGTVRGAQGPTFFGGGQQAVAYGAPQVVHQQQPVQQPAPAQQPFYPPVQPYQGGYQQGYQTAP